MWVVDGTININAHFVGTIDELEVETFQQFFFRQLILHGMIFQTKDFIVCVAQLGILDQRILFFKKQMKKKELEVVIDKKQMPNDT